MIRDDVIKLPSGMFSNDELKCVIDYVCTSYSWLYCLSYLSQFFT
jgi:hypothetical protein